MTYLRNTWYLAAFADELATGRMLARTLLGEPDAADASLIADCSEVIEAPRDATVRGYLPTACHYRLLVDNILDLTHGDYLHAGSLGTGDYAPPAVDSQLRRPVLLPCDAAAARVRRSLDAMIKDGGGTP